MRGNASKFLIYQDSVKDTKYWANYADENVLLLTHNRTKAWTDLTDPIIQYVSSAAPSLSDKRTPLQDFLKGSGRTRTIDTDYVRWKLKGTGEFQAIASRNLNGTNKFPGQWNQLIEIELDLETFVEGDLIAPDIAKDCPVRVDALPMKDGTNFVYSVLPVLRREDDYYPPELLEAGIKWIKVGAAYGEASRAYGSTSFTGTSYLEFETRLSDWGKQVEVTNKAHNLNLRLAVRDEKGMAMKEYPDQIISYIEAEFIAQAKWEKELMLYYGRSSAGQIIDQSVGYEVNLGPGLLEFLEDGNVIPYALGGGSIDMFVDYLQQIWFDRVSPENRNITIYTGQGGLMQWEKWINEKYSQSAVRTGFADVTRSGKSYDSKNYEGRKFKTAYFTEYAIFPFGSLRVEHWPILDNMWLNGGLKHPETGFPLSSYEYIVLDQGLGDGGGSNIELLKREDSEVYTYHCGVWSPAGPLNTRTGRGGFVSAGPQRSYILYAADTFGLRVRDVSLTAWFRPAVAL